MKKPASYPSNRIYYLMGVSGSGKSSVGLQLSKATGIPFYDGDDFHPAANIEKMASGQPLNDQDRYDWLLAIHAFVEEQLRAGHSAIIACSALKGSYRKILEKGIPDQVNWIFLKGSFELIHERMKQRKDHFMPVSLLQSQFDQLEPPKQAFDVDISRSLPDIVEYISTFIKAQN